MEGEVTNTITVSALLRFTDLSNAGASAVMHVTISDLVSPPFSLPHFLPPSLPFPVCQTLSMPT